MDVTIFHGSPHLVRSNRLVLPRGAFQKIIDIFNIISKLYIASADVVCAAFGCNFDKYSMDRSLSAPNDTAYN